jgi:hypothetical protein
VTAPTPTGAGPAAERQRHLPRFDGWMAIGAVAVTLLGAYIAWRQNKAIDSASAAAVKSQRYGIAAVQARAGANDAAQLQYSRYLLLESERRRLGNALQAVQLGDASKRDAVRRLRLMSGRTLTESTAIAAGQTAMLKGPSTVGTGAVLGRRLCPITPRYATPPKGCDRRDSPGGDPAFPRAYFADATWQAERLTALRDAASEIAGRKGKELSAYAITLSAFGIAVFLFGFTLTEEGRERRRVFVAAALLMIAASLLYSGDVYREQRSLPSHGPSDDAPDARAYATGMVALAKDDGAGAERALETSIDARPSFTRAYAQRAAARELSGASLPESEPGLRVLPLITLQGAADDLRFARDHDLVLPAASLGLATALTQLELRSRHPGAGLGEARAAVAAARAADPDAAMPAIDGGLLAVLDGNACAAQRLLEEGIVLSRRHGPGRTARGACHADPGVLQRAGVTGAARQPDADLAGALTGLELAVAHGHLARRAADGLEADATATAYPTAPLRLHADALSARVTPGGVEWSARLSDDHGAPVPVDALSPHDTGLSTEWWIYDRAAGAWAVVPELSGEAKPAAGGAGLVAERATFVGATARLTRPSCLPPGDYRFALRQDGRLIGRVTTRLSGPRMTARFQREMNIALCVPPGWSPVAHVTGVGYNLLGVPAGAAAWRAPDRDSGVLIVRLNGQFAAKDFGGGEQPWKAARTARLALRKWVGILPRTRGTRPVPARRWVKGDLDLGFATGTGIRMDFNYSASAGGRGVARTLAGYNKNDLAVVIAAFGPASATAAAQRDAILESVGQALG